MNLTNTITTAVLATATFATSSQMAYGYGENWLYASSGWTNASAISDANGYTWDADSSNSAVYIDENSDIFIDEHSHRSYIVEGNFYTGFQCAWSSMHSTAANHDAYPAHLVECDISLSAGVMRFVSPGETSEPMSVAAWKSNLWIDEHATVEIAYQAVFYKQTLSQYSNALSLLIYNNDTHEYELRHATAATRNGNDVRVGVVDADLARGNYTVYVYLSCVSYGNVAYPMLENVQSQCEVQIRETR